LLANNHIHGQAGAASENVVPFIHARNRRSRARLKFVGGIHAKEVHCSLNSQNVTVSSLGWALIWINVGARVAKVTASNRHHVHIGRKAGPVLVPLPFG
jgi:hypothetical protein